MKVKLISVSVAALMLSACNMAPDMEQRELPVAQNYDIQGTAGDINALNWQSFFSNTQLQQLIALTLENNKDIKTAAALLIKCSSLTNSLNLLIFRQTKGVDLI